MSTITSSNYVNYTATANAKSTSNSTDTSAQMNQFMTILLTQLQHQSPLDPMDTTEFTAQIAQYSQLEQQVNTNSKLDSLLSALSSNSLSPISYLGNTVEYASDVAPVQNGQASWAYEIEGAAKVELTVTDSSGKVVYSAAGDSSNGKHVLNLKAASDGSADGAQLTLTVKAYDANGNVIDRTSVTAYATVDSVSTVSGKAVLEANGMTIDADDVLRVSKPASTEVATPTDETSDENSNA